MSDILMLGKPPDGIRFEEVPWQYYIGTNEKDGEDFVDLDKGMGELFKTFSLWHLIDKSRAEELGGFFDNVMHSDLNNREFLYPGEDKYGYLIDVKTTKKLYELIDDIDEIIAERFTGNDYETTWDYYALPEKEEILKGNYLGEIDEKTGKLSLKNEISSAKSIKWFLKTAIDNNRELVIE